VFECSRWEDTAHGMNDFFFWIGCLCVDVLESLHDLEIGSGHTQIICNMTEQNFWWFGHNSNHSLLWNHLSYTDWSSHAKRLKRIESVLMHLKHVFLALLIFIRGIWKLYCLIWWAIWLDCECRWLAFRSINGNSSNSPDSVYSMIISC
jgi:hypothetical protein